MRDPMAPKFAHFPLAGTVAFVPVDVEGQIRYATGVALLALPLYRAATIKLDPRDVESLIFPDWNAGVFDLVEVRRRQRRGHRLPPRKREVVAGADATSSPTTGSAAGAGGGSGCATSFGTKA